MISNGSGRVTLKDIAQQCGYTANTVSRALRGDKKLPE
ncbi:MAG: LacI family DNA-binding transcriptional regulator, partial [Clostridia bacterium]|nr:LacI family DNA-binding transcriptional regulator [Clostridia bacterium]